MTNNHRTLREVGERYIVREILGMLKPSERLLDGFGHDAAFFDMQLERDEILVINSDRSGLNIAYQLGLAGPQCVGDLGVSHAVSDIVAAGGQPEALSVALLLPADTRVDFVRELMQGAEAAARRYGAVLTGGDTKKNPKFAMVVTAIGKANRDKRLTRSSACSGDALVVTGNIGAMLLGTLAYKNDLSVPKGVRALLDQALIQQQPPFDLGRAFADAGVARACMDISDGLSGTLFSICGASQVGAIIDERAIPIHPDLRPLAESLGLRPMQLALGGGDWQYLYAIPVEKLTTAQRIAETLGARIATIGKTTTSLTVIARTLEGEYRHLQRIEHDSFRDGGQGMSYFEWLGNPLNCFGETLDPATHNDCLLL
ncbi:MAG: thiamine-monophosphate kinase [Thiocapsa sp.]|uniref:thiamine-phosphate kinase n=1 Tax=Thiocapsa sp. TaxID=2024551 RepID=UPI001BD0A517|nr:thiamine-phosphate kinase [Thiocapsa sp.]QVL49481.1 MAG: thiamine-monophosphate kinase [Thiocapsa sp.]